MPAKKPVVMLNSRVMQSSSIDNNQSKNPNFLVAGESTQHMDSSRDVVNIEIMKQKN